MQNVGIDWHVYVLTHSPLALGTVGLVRVLPIVFFSMWGGVVADRYDRKWVQFITQSILATNALLLALATWFGRDSVWLIYGITALTGATSAFDAPARQALIPKLVPADDLQGALSINLMGFQIGVIVGPALAGMLIALGGVRDAHHTQHLAIIYFANAMSFVAVLVALLMMRTSGRPERRMAGPSHPTELLREGIRFLFSTPVIVWTMSLDFFATLFSGAISLLPIVADQVLHVGATGYGWLRAGTGAGALVSSLIVAVVPLPRKQGPILLWSVAAYGAATIVYGLSRSFVLTFVALCCVGAADLVSTVVRQTLRQILTPDELRGRITAFNMIFFLGGPQLGEFEAGAVAALFPPAAFGAMVSIASGGAITILVVAIVAAAAPVVRNYTLRTEQAASPLPQEL